MLDRDRLLAASVVAARSLRANIREVRDPDGRSRRLVTAGPGQFGSVWTRDFAWAAEGLLSAGEDDAVRATLDALLEAQRADGLIPRLLDTRWPWARFARAVLKERLPLAAPLVPNFRSDQFVLAFDANALLVWAACRYALQTDSLAWAGLVLPRLENAMAWYAPHETDGLVRQPPCSDWKDKIKARRGAVFYTNLTRWKALLSLAELYAALGRTARAAEAAAVARTLRRRLQRAFWNAEGGFFNDSDGFPLLSSDGNLAACLWGFADDEQAGRIVRAMDRLGLWTAWGPRASQPYPLSEKSWLTRLAGIPGYHDDGVWLWQSALALRVLAAMGRVAPLKNMTAGVVGLVLREGAAGEVYDPVTGRPLSGRLYRAESPFTWSAAMLLESFTELLKNQALIPQLTSDFSLGSDSSESTSRTSPRPGA